MALQVRRYGRFHDGLGQGAGRGKPASEEDVCRVTDGRGDLEGSSGKTCMTRPVFASTSFEGVARRSAKMYPAYCGGCWPPGLDGDPRMSCLLNGAVYDDHCFAQA
jgi:hypothetical protein